MVWRSALVLTSPAQKKVANPSIAPLYYLVRRPTHILDFALTLTFIHLILASYYSMSFPTSMFFWVVMSTGSIMMIVVAEQVCASFAA